MDRTFHGSRAWVVRVAGAALMASTLVAPSANAVTLNPPPPDFESCHGSGRQTICTGNRVEPGHVEPTGILCFEGEPGEFELVDVSQSTFQHATRWYDADGNLVRRETKEVWAGTSWVSSTTGDGVRYHQSQTIIDLLATPGDLGVVRETTTGVINFLVPGRGAIVRNAGRTVFGFDGTLEFSSGPQAILDYFGGDAAALQPICDALRG
jgi:hypothetical protein